MVAKTGFVRHGASVTDEFRPKHSRSFFCITCPNRLIVEAMTEEVSIAVGTPITGRPPHRTVRAAFLHTAPTSDVGRLASRPSVRAPAPVTRFPGGAGRGSWPGAIPGAWPPAPRRCSRLYDTVPHRFRYALVNHRRHKIAGQRLVLFVPEATVIGRFRGGNGLSLSTYDQGAAQKDD